MRKARDTPHLTFIVAESQVWRERDGGIEETFPKYGLKKYFIKQAKVF